MCYKSIPPNSFSHDGDHIHKEDAQHFCNKKCPFCSYYVKIFNLLISRDSSLRSSDIFFLQCTLPYEHVEKEHSTNHGNMNQTKFIAEDDVFEYGGIIFSVTSFSNI